LVNKVTLKDEQMALVVENVSKGFHLPQLTLWERMRGKRLELNFNGDLSELPAGKNGKKPVIAVERANFSVPRGEIFGVLGPNGSGKSTLIRLICTLLTPDAGDIRVFGYDVGREEMAVKNLISRVSVDAAFFKKLSPMENLLYGARLYGVGGKEAQEKAQVIMARLGLDKSTYYEPMEEMSRGMQQKVAIARAFLTTPVLLLLDEPTTGLDPRSKREVRAFVEELRDTHDATIIITTHDMEEADALCDRIAVIHNGKTVALDTPHGLKTSIPHNGHLPTLEDVFMHLTGEQLVREDETPEPQVETA
jgi:ABC-2 type transport system ATP-binding protein